MKKGWEVKPLGEVCEVVNGGTPKSAIPEYWNGNNRWITPAEMGKRLSPYISKTERMISDLGLRNSSAQMLPPNSVILSSRAPIGYLVINTEPMATNQGCKGLIPRNQLQHKFLYYYLTSIVDLLNSLGSGATFKELSGGKLKEVNVPIPPLSEQHRIVGLLDEAFEGIAIAKANAEKNLQNARAIFESHLQAVFSQRGEGWVEKRIEEWCDSVIDCVNKTAPVVEYQTPFKMIRTTNVRNGRVDVSKVKYVTEETYKIWIRRQTPQTGDVILTREAPMGEVGMLLTEDKIFLGQRLVSYRTNSTILDNKFLLFAMQSSGVQSQIIAKASGSTVQHMRVPDTKNLLLAAPPLGKQRKTVEKMEMILAETQRLAAIYQQKLDALEALKKSLLHQAFNGEL
jgi:type I restriction enzyme S subunit